ncbi:MAG: SusD/RagB family nutrient-binding outer membrane lipoprotein [Gemmatimonadaceae bacterium]|nr:SusD/RagB family nutrient-binding outer membrane lipoprotein [Gemmatimonadaceae bacterium]
MKRYIWAVGVAAGVLLMAGCNDFLNCDECQKDPNRQLSATMLQRLTGIESVMGSEWNSHLARSTNMWTQQVAGTDRQYAQLAKYTMTESDFTGEFSGMYTAGGLIDIRALEAQADSAGNEVFGGLARILEALDLGMGASIWGDIPASQAGDIDQYPVPQLDAQSAVYAMVQAKLDTGIALLTSGSGSGPGKADVWLGGDIPSWIKVAHTLKGRFYMHWVEAQRRGDATAAQEACGGDCVTKALAEFPLGISDTTHQLMTWNSGTPGEWNWWYDFVVFSRSGYLSPSAVFVDTMVARDDPRLSAYFQPNFLGVYKGAAEGGPADSTTSDFGTDSKQRMAIDARIPFVTLNENLLHWAEAAFYASDEVTAKAKLNAYETVNGLPATNLSGNALLQEIAIQEWIGQFMNVDAYNDWKRTCWPNIAPAVSGKNVPGRPFYGVDERNANPNIVPPSDQPARNANDPAGGMVTAAIGATCEGSK